MASLPNPSGLLSLNKPFGVSSCSIQGRSVLPSFDPQSLPHSLPSLSSIGQALYTDVASLTTEQSHLATRLGQLRSFRQSLITIQPNAWAIRADREINDQIRALADSHKSVSCWLRFAKANSRACLAAAGQTAPITVAPSSMTDAISTCPRVLISFGCCHAYLSPAGPSCPGTNSTHDHAVCAPVHARFEQKCASCSSGEAQLQLWEDDYAFGIAYTEVASSRDSEKELQTWNDVNAENEALIAAISHDQPSLTGWQCMLK